jgi:predicted dehydrogenase
MAPTDKVRLAFVGFRHGHIMSLYNLASGREDIEIVAACEEDAAARAQTAAAGKVKITHDSYRAMLDDTPCDAVAVGDYFGARGSRAIEALLRGKHVISDKPLCTSLAELDRIEGLARERGLAVGCMLDMREGGAVLEARRLIAAGEIGDVHVIMPSGQHPLFWGSRPGWYFEPGKHGGTINDIAIHAIDAIPWMTGQAWKRLEAARGWNARVPSAPYFQDCGQFMATLANGCGVLCDVSYLSPDAAGYTMPQYWRMAFWGDKGVIEVTPTANQVALYRNDAKTPEVITAGSDRRGANLDAFLAEVRGQREGLHLSTAEVIAASRVALLIQRAADEGTTQVALAPTFADRP